MPAPAHTPVLPAEVLAAAPARVRAFADLTLGAAGHARLLAKKFPGARIFAADRDGDARKIAEKNLAEAGLRAEIFPGNFSDFPAWFSDKFPDEKLDFILADLGVSSIHLDRPERGFSFRAAGPLDMRMDPTSGFPASAIVDHAPRVELERVLRDGGASFPGRIAAGILAARPIRDTAHFAEVVENALPRAPRSGKIRAATLAFQAIRIAVNGEFDAIRDGLPAAAELLAPGGRLAVISFHSGEDGLVKNIFRELGRAGRVKILTKKPIGPDPVETAENPRSRSAKLRIVEKI